MLDNNLAMLQFRKKVVRLSPFEEVVGTLHELEVEDESMMAQIWKVFLILPIEMKIELTPLIGQKIGIIRTDDANRPYRWRKCEEDLEVAATEQFIESRNELEEKLYKKFIDKTRNGIDERSGSIIDIAVDCFGSNS